jgi:hypothetical protein
VEKFSPANAQSDAWKSNLQSFTDKFRLASVAYWPLFRRRQGDQHRRDTKFAQRYPLESEFGCPPTRQPPRGQGNHIQHDHHHCRSRRRKLFAVPKGNHGTAYVISVAKGPPHLRCSCTPARLSHPGFRRTRTRLAATTKTKPLTWSVLPKCLEIHSVSTEVARLCEVRQGVTLSFQSV